MDRGRHRRDDDTDYDPPTCPSCVFSQADNELHAHLCHRYPSISGGYPIVHPNDWCGEFRDLQ